MDAQENNDLAFIYLARLSEGFPTFETFVKNYFIFPPGWEHDFVIIAKGFTRCEEIATLESIFKDIPHRIINVSDDIGLDIHAYREVANQIKNKYVCFFNTNTWPNTENWLLKLYDHIKKPSIGLVGATGSYESQYNSSKLINAANYAITLPCAYNKDLIKRFGWLIGKSNRVNFLHASYRRLRSLLSGFTQRRKPLDKALELFLTLWSHGMGCEGNTLRSYRDFPKFPNPHIRSTAFMIRREDFLSIPFAANQKTKINCCQFESGQNGMTWSILHKGLNILVVGADGIGYTMEQWPKSKTFRLGDQSNLLAVDKQTRNFKHFTETVRQIHLTMTWGGYNTNNTNNTNLSVLGITFPMHLNLYHRVMNFKSKMKVKNNKLFSIVIPTHNRLSLLLDGIKTIIAQRYQDWEVIIFDNASYEPVMPAIAQFGDERIKCKRSDKFLSVTDSWNQAIKIAKGEYITLIGDDDGLAPIFFEHLNNIANNFESPELIFSSLYQFVHPEVSSEIRTGYVASLPTAGFFKEYDYPFILEPSIVKESVTNSLTMKQSFMFSMPAITIHRNLISKMCVYGSIFKSPLPAHYFANVALSLADRVIANPEPVAFQGISKQSFINLLKVDSERAFKNLNYKVESDSLYEEIADKLLPGSQYNSAYILAMFHVTKTLNCAHQMLDYNHYRRLQISEYLFLQPNKLKWIFTEQGKNLFKKMTIIEKLWSIRAIITYKIAKDFPTVFDPFVKQRFIRKTDPNEWKANQIMYHKGDYVTLSDIYNALQDGSFWLPLQDKAS